MKVIFTNIMTTSPVILHMVSTVKAIVKVVLLAAIPKAALEATPRLPVNLHSGLPSGLST